LPITKSKGFCNFLKPVFILASSNDKAFDRQKFKRKSFYSLCQNKENNKLIKISFKLKFRDDDKA
jgi:hypothetical protein